MNSIVSASARHRMWPGLHAVLWRTLPKHPVPMRAVFDRVWLLNLHVPVGVLGRLLPEGILPDVHDDRAWLSIVCADMSDMRPTFLPGLFGVPFRQVVYRACVRCQGEPGVFFLHTEANHRLYAWGGDLLTFFHFHPAQIDFECNGSESTLTVRTPWSSDLDVALNHDGRWTSSHFASSTAARPFLVDRYVAFNLWRGRLGRVEVTRPAWQEHPVSVPTLNSAFCDAALPGWKLDSAVYGEAIPYRWTRRRLQS